MSKVIRTDSENYVIESKIVKDGYVLGQNEYFVDGDDFDIEEIGRLFDVQTKKVTNTRKPQPPVTQITKLAFSNRFTLDEEVAIETALESTPRLRVMQRKLDRSEFIDLASPQTQQLVNSLVPDFITAERATEILTAPVQREEAYF